MDAERSERLPVSVSAAVFIEDDQGKLLLLQQSAERKGHKWGPPAGGMEPFEDPNTTAKREAKEEIGVEIELIDLIGIYTVTRGLRASGVGFVYRGKIVSGEIQLKEGEIADARYFSREEVQQLMTQGMIYKPEYNLPSIADWLSGSSFRREVIRPLG